MLISATRDLREAIQRLAVFPGHMEFEKARQTFLYIYL